MLLGTEQKPMEWMTDLVSNFCKVRKAMLDTNTRTLAAVKALLQLPKHHRPAGDEKDSFLHDTRLLLMEIHAKEVLRLLSYKG